MIRINLLPIKEAQRALGRRNQLSVALLSITLALLVMVIPYVLQGRSLTHLDADIDQLRTEIQKFNEQTKEVRDLEKKKTELQAKLKIIEDLKQKRVGPVHVLEDLGAAAPDKLWLVEFNEVNGMATITGLSLDNQTIAGFMRKLQGSKYFFDVDLVETSQSEPIRSPAGGDAGMIFKKFIIKAHLDYLGTGGQTQVPPATGAPAGAKTGAKTGA
jgi:type IV pilus assembly protein PilN